MGLFPEKCLISRFGFKKYIKHEKLIQIKRLIQSGNDKCVICEQAAISLGSLNRILRSDHNLLELWRRAQFTKKRSQRREHFLKVLKQNPGIPIKLVREIPGNGYQWLYRHDRIWLRENIPIMTIIK